MLAAAFPDMEQGPREALVPEFLTIYQEELGRHSVLFDGVAEMLGALEAAGSVWGIVTNKPEYLARDILPQLGWSDRCAVLIGGDTLAEKKPHPLPLLHAAKFFNIPIQRLLLIGDSLSDTVAARAAGCPVFCVPYGYNHGEPVETLELDAVIQNLSGALPLIKRV